MSRHSVLPPEFVPDDMAHEHATPLIDFARRSHQMYFTLTPAEVRRLMRFGAVMRWADGTRVYHAGQCGHAMLVILSGHIAMSRDDGMGRSSHIIDYGPGQFTGEVAQLTNRPSLAHGDARGELQALAIDSEALRAIVVAEAELGERIMRALILRRLGLIQANGSGPVLIGPPACPAMVDMRNFLSSNGHPYTMRDPASDLAAAELVRIYQPAKCDWPLVVAPDGSVRMRPSIADVGRSLGLLPEFDSQRVYDMLVVGAGPAGLAAAVYAASEGLSVLVLEQRAYGGQAGTSARIENYLGFPTGISGRALAGRAYVQAHKFGAEVAIPAGVSRLLCDIGHRHAGLQVELQDGARLRAHTVVLACGAHYRRPVLSNLDVFEGRGVYYWASPIEGQLCKQEPVVLVGGGNSAGQAAVYLATQASYVHMLVRGEGLSATMSSYLVERIRATPNIVLHSHSELATLGGDDDGLHTVTWRHGPSGAETVAAVRRLFLFIGAEPNTGWLADCAVGLDKQQFVLTGSDVVQDVERQPPRYSLAMAGRAALETSVRGVFAVGDVRAGSTKRVAAAVGEGAAVVAQIHAYLEALVQLSPNE